MMEFSLTFSELFALQPYVSSKHPSYEHLRQAGALFKDPATGKHSTTVSWPDMRWFHQVSDLVLPFCATKLVWSGLFEENFEGSWVVRSL